MTGQSTISPIQAYFAQALRGKSTWPYWLFGLFFAGGVFALGQLLVALPMMSYLMPPEAAAISPAAVMIGMLVVTFIVALVITVPMLLFFLGERASPESRKVLHIVGGIIAALVAIVGIFSVVAGSGDGAESQDILSAAISSSPFFYSLLLISFIPMILGVFAAVKFVHRRPIKSLLTAHTHFRWGRLFQTMLVFWVIAAALGFATHFLGLSDYEYVFDPSRFAIYALISLLFIPLQSAAEEILLRGYLNQGLGKYIKNPWIVFVITSAGFMALHLGNPEAAKGAENGTFVLTMGSYFAFGMIACILTYMDGGLESAIGMHVANNLFASTMMGYDDSVLPTPTVFNTTLDPSKDMILLVLSMALMLFILWKWRKPLQPDLPTSADLADEHVQAEVFS
ncbi:CPBP family intramembrane glutamic endopeptidase [Robiginitomaculum antarcticum]|uniref:CPBP family intramembrane glutamic endopeptidase n=1 Tax=Robiginitomaculum antarcticum TaxID=437507 RepID=UPI00037A9FC5|nr:CPBP family intramembrane glutamic endopeptidase [Robiginitomaculum antarcticum]